MSESAANESESVVTEEKPAEEAATAAEELAGEANPIEEQAPTDSSACASTSSDEPPSKKKKLNPPVKGKKGDPFPYARLRGIRIFTDREIEAQDAEMTREYWKFWNRTAEELCSDRAYNDWGKRDLKLYIDAAWIIHKTYLQELAERDLSASLRETQEICGLVEMPQKIKNQDETVTKYLSKLQDSTANLNQLNLELTRARGKSMNIKQRPVTAGFPQKQKDQEVGIANKQIGELEKNLYDGMSEVKRDQDSLKKSLGRLKNLLFKFKAERGIK